MGSGDRRRGRCLVLGKVGTGNQTEGEWAAREARRAPWRDEETREEMDSSWDLNKQAAPCLASGAPWLPASLTFPRLVIPQEDPSWGCLPWGSPRP